jgi:DNA-binding XRE family transcriptional regulator
MKIPRGRDIKHLRQEVRGITQDRVHKRAGISLQELISIERERTRPSREVAERIMAAIEALREETARAGG